MAKKKWTEGALCRDGMGKTWPGSEAITFFKGCSRASVALHTGMWFGGGIGDCIEWSEEDFDRIYGLDQAPRRRASEEVFMEL